MEYIQTDLLASEESKKHRANLKIASQLQNGHFYEKLQCKYKTSTISFQLYFSKLKSPAKILFPNNLKQKQTSVCLS